MLNNRLELIKDGQPKALLTWHLPREDGHFHAIAFQFAEDLADEARHEVFSIAKRPLKIPSKQNKPAQLGSSDHFEALARPLSRLGYRTRYFGVAQHEHPLSDRPVESV